MKIPFLPKKRSNENPKPIKAKKPKKVKQRVVTADENRVQRVRDYEKRLHDMSSRRPDRRSYDDKYRQ